MAVSLSDMPNVALSLVENSSLGKVLLSWDDGGVNLLLSQVGCSLVSDKGSLDIM